MALSNAICTHCHIVNGVNPSEETTVCRRCGKEFSNKEGMDAWDRAYVVTVKRVRDPKIKDSITFNLVHAGKVSTLANDGSVIMLISDATFEIPVRITDNKKITFEGVLTGVGDGKDIEIVWAAKRGEPQLGSIVSSTNPTVQLVERAAAASSVKLWQEES